MGTLISWLSLLIGLAAFGYAWRLQQELGRTTRRLDRYNRALFDAGDEIRQLRDDLHDTLAQLRVESQQSGAGVLTFTPKMTVHEATLVHPQAEQVLAGFHLGGCSSCAVDPDETLAQICRENGRDLTELLRNLNLLSEHGQHGVGLQPVKLPNVEFSL